MPTTTESRSTSRSRRRRRFGRRSERGAALVEFALIAMPLFLILFGTIEFGWAMFQYNDIRHGAREGIRVAVVNADPDPMTVLEDGMTTWNAAITAEFGSSVSDEVYKTALLAQSACARMDQRDNVFITLRYSDSISDGELTVGDDLELIAYKAQLEQLTMFLDAALNVVDLQERIASRLEQNPPEGVVKDKDYPQDGGWRCRQ